MIRRLLATLDPIQRKQLMYAFEHEIMQYIKLPGGHFLGVHIESVAGLTVLETAGVWAYGRIDGS
jgi:hypothetical protein